MPLTHGSLAIFTNPPSRVSSPVDGLLSPKDLAGYLGVPLATVYRWRSHHDGPRGIRVGRHVRYRFTDVERWLDGLRDQEAT